MQSRLSTRPVQATLLAQNCASQLLSTQYAMAAAAAQVMRCAPYGAGHMESSWILPQWQRRLRWTMPARAAAMSASVLTWSTLMHL